MPASWDGAASLGAKLVRLRFEAEAAPATTRVRSFFGFHAALEIASTSPMSDPLNLSVMQEYNVVREADAVSSHDAVYLSGTASPPSHPIP
jgi:hypothetical protein